MDGTPPSPLAPPPRRPHAWELVALAGLGVAVLATFGTFWGERAAIAQELGQLQVSSLIAQVGILFGKFPVAMAGVLALLAFMALGVRQWSISTRTGATIRHSARILARSWHIALFLAVLNGGVGWILADLAARTVLKVFFGGASLAGSPFTANRMVLVASEFTQMFVLLPWNCFVGSFAAAAGIYLWVQHEKGRPTSFYEAINYALNRYGRVLRAHSRSYVTISVGMIIVVPGILFGLQYAFVDAIATLDSAEKDPLRRSRKLTSGRRGTIFRTFAPFVIWWLPIQLIGGRYMLQGQGILLYGLGGIIDHLILLVLELCMVQYYLDLFRKPATKTNEPPAPEASEIRPAT